MKQYNDHKPYWEYQDKYAVFKQKTPRSRNWLKISGLSALAACIFSAALIGFHIPMKRARDAADKQAFRALLFADQELADLLAMKRALSDTPDIPWDSFKTANDLCAGSNIQQAVAEFRKTLAVPAIPARVRLWTWNAMRRLGVRPPPRDSFIIHGVLVEIPMDTGIDTLAVYDDGSACYIDQSGRIMPWRGYNTVISAICRQVLLETRPFLQNSRTSDRGKPISSGFCRITILTIAGNHTFESRLDSPVPTALSAMNLMKEIRKISRDPERKTKEANVKPEQHS
jgi:hypothetical protein